MTEFDCPFCSCGFVSRKDLDCHLALFGDRGLEAHLARLREAHRREGGPPLPRDFLRRGG